MKGDGGARRARGRRRYLHEGARFKALRSGYQRCQQGTEEGGLPEGVDGLSSSLATVTSPSILAPSPTDSCPPSPGGYTRIPPLTTSEDVCMLAKSLVLPCAQMLCRHTRYSDHVGSCIPPPHNTRVRVAPRHLQQQNAPLSNPDRLTVEAQHRVPSLARTGAAADPPLLADRTGGPEPRAATNHRASRLQVDGLPQAADGTLHGGSAASVEGVRTTCVAHTREP